MLILTQLFLSSFIWTSSASNMVEEELRLVVNKGTHGSLHGPTNLNKGDECITDIKPRIILSDGLGCTNY